MRPFLLVLAAVVSTWAAPAAIDVRGTARVQGRLQTGVVIWLEAPEAPRAPDQARYVVDQRNLSFMPRVLAVPVGATVEFPNNDRVFHNVFSFRDGRRFDLGLYPIGEIKRVRFDKAGVSRLFCNIHPQMAAYVVAVESPYFAVSDAAGQFVLRAVPAGDYIFHAWRSGGPTLTSEVTIGAGAEMQINWP